ncbi:hypothetical protein NQ314_005822 [Rhamnusium bicolor]|uniref:1-acylglycerol-3-phosphate O-acyltransferase n=1 Tax=Rhamnusium bicolor TaxID=1586634 RepID=A0AAV8ZFN9_9CUCU|nr:hypothetical protein NQ314_005822 [Rhamnusium bicolor]
MTASYTEIVLAGCILILPFLYESSHVFRYHLKFFLYYLIVMINSVILIPVYCFKPKNVRNLFISIGFLQAYLDFNWIKMDFKRQGTSRKRSGLYNCLQSSKFHRCIGFSAGMFDIWHAMDKCTVIAKRELFYAWPFGLAAWLCGLIFIPRIQTEKAKEIMSRAVETVKADKVSINIFLGFSFVENEQNIY